MKLILICIKQIKILLFYLIVQVKFEPDSLRKKLFFYDTIFHIYPVHLQRHFICHLSHRNLSTKFNMETLQHSKPFCFALLSPAGNTALNTKILFNPLIHLPQLI